MATSLSTVSRSSPRWKTGGTNIPSRFSISSRNAAPPPVSSPRSSRSSAMNNKAVRLDQLVELRIEKISAGKDQSKPYIGLEHLGPGCSGLLGWSGAGDSVSVNSIFRSGDILFGKLRPNLRKCERVSFDGYCSTDILVLRARQGVDPGFAARVVQSVQVFNEAARSAEGTKMPRTSWSKLRWFAVPWVPLPEQRRIGEILDTVDEEIRSTERLI